MLSIDHVKRHLPVIITGLAVFVIVVSRAARQAITFDEAFAYLNFISSPFPKLWDASPANHVLNTIAESIMVHLFGASVFAIRIPACLGAIIYICTSAAFSIRTMRTPLKSAIALIVLTLNPFILDYLVPARGYSLALAFFILGLWFLTSTRAENESHRAKTLTLASVSLALSLCANFSFAFAILASLIVFATIAILTNHTHRLQSVLATILPLALIPPLICGPALLNSNRGEFFYGATTVADSVQSLVTASMDGPNDFLVNGYVVAILSHVRDILPTLVSLACIVGASLLLIRGRRLQSSVALSFYLTLILAFAAHVTMHAFIGLPLPLSRTGIFFVPLLELAILFTVAESSFWLYSRGSEAVVALISIFFISSIRTSHIREWTFDQNVSSVYAALKVIAANNRSVHIASNFLYAPALNFYQAIDKTPNFMPIDMPPDNHLSADRNVFVLSPGVDDTFAKDHNLSIVLSYPFDGLANVKIGVTHDIKVPPLSQTPP